MTTGRINQVAFGQKHLRFLFGPFWCDSQRNEKKIPRTFNRQAKWLGFCHKGTGIPRWPLSRLRRTTEPSDKSRGFSIQKNWNSPQFTVDSRLVFPLKLLLDFKRDGSRNPPKEFHRWWFRKGREVTRTLTALSFPPWKMCMI